MIGLSNLRYYQAANKKNKTETMEFCLHDMMDITYFKCGVYRENAQYPSGNSLVINYRLRELIARGHPKSLSYERENAISRPLQR